MSNEFNIDLNNLLNECKLSSNEDSSLAFAKIIDLESRHTLEEMAIIYNHFLKNIKSNEVLMYVLKRINAYKPQICFDTLIDLILWKENFKNSLQDAEQYIDLRVNTAKVISNYKDNKAVLPLMYCMNNKDENYKIRLACAEALGKIGDKYAVTPLIDIVTDEEEKSVYVRESAAMALGMIGDMRAVDSLVNILEAKKTFLSKFTFLKERVIEALGKINSPNERVFKALKNSLDDESPQVRIQTIETLMNSEDEKAVELIKKALFDTNADVVENAVIALYNLEGADILNHILETENYPYSAKEKAREILDEYEDE